MSTTLEFVTVAETEHYAVIVINAKYHLLNKDSQVLEAKSKKLPIILSAMLSSEDFLNTIHQNNVDENTEMPSDDKVIN